MKQQRIRWSKILITLFAYVEHRYTSRRRRGREIGAYHLVNKVYTRKAIRRREREREREREIGAETIQKFMQQRPCDVNNNIIIGREREREMGKEGCD